MKNIHILPTDKPSRLHFDHTGLFLSKNYQLSTSINSIVKGKNIYITDDSEIKEGDWFISNGLIYKVNRNVNLINPNKDKKIILTTDQDLIKDGIQQIDNEFLEWYVKNPSCEEVKVEITEISCIIPNFGDVDKYKIIIPKEEPKQETLEEAAENYSKLIPFVDEITTNNSKLDFIAGAKWQQEKSYNELFEWLASKDYLSDKVDVIQKEFKQFKSK